jgi:hypothetical protein
MSTHQNDAADCDVRNRENLEIFRRKRAEWMSWLKSDDPHSIWRQIQGLLWDDVLFRTVNELRREAVEHPKGDVGFNADFLRLIDAGFVTIQATAIRRLTDKPSSDPKKAFSP